MTESTHDKFEERASSILARLRGELALLRRVNPADILGRVERFDVMLQVAMQRVVNMEKELAASEKEIAELKSRRTPRRLSGNQTEYRGAILEFETPDRPDRDSQRSPPISRPKLPVPLDPDLLVDARVKLLRVLCPVCHSVMQSPSKDALYECTNRNCRAKADFGEADLDWVIDELRYGDDVTPV